jgi:hypothetical protein
VENCEGEKIGKDKKKDRRRKIELLSLCIIPFPSYSENHFIKNGSS